MTIEDNDPNGDLEITVDDVIETPAGADKEIPVEGSGKAEGAEDWKAQFEAAQKEAEEAKRLAQQRADEVERVQRENAQVKTTAASAEMLALDNALANVKHEQEDAKAKYRQALAEGDFDAAADAQASFTEIALKAQRIKEGKEFLERRAEDARNAPDPVEQFVSTLSPASASWVRNHPDSIKNRAELERAHYGAVYNKITPDTPEYFQFLEQELGYSQKPAERSEPAVETRRAPTAPAAPVSRGGSAEAPQARSTTIRLTAAQREIAALSGLTDAEYAKQLLAIQRENATTH